MLIRTVNLNSGGMKGDADEDESEVGMALSCAFILSLVVQLPYLTFFSKLLMFPPEIP